jgi:hypothetical protein
VIRETIRSMDMVAIGTVVFPCVHAAATTAAQRLNVSLRSFHPDISVFPDRVDPRIVLFEDCSAFTLVAACTLALLPICDTLIEGFSHFVTSMTAPIASGRSGCRVGLAPTGKRRLCTAHTHSGHPA